MDARLISDLPDDAKNRIAAVLDSPELPNWRWLIREVIRQHIPSYKGDSRIGMEIGMETLLPGGSPTLKLLNDLGQRGITVGVLRTWISSINERTPGLQTIVNLLSKLADFVDCCSKLLLTVALFLENDHLQVLKLENFRVRAVAL